LLCWIETNTFIIVFQFFPGCITILKINRQKHVVDETISGSILVIKPTRCTNFSNLFLE